MSDQKPWLDKYPEGVNHEINPEAYASLIDLVETGFAEHADAEAYTFMDKTITFSELNEQSEHFAAYLQGLGLQQGDKVALQMPNCMQYPIALFGAIRAGLVVVNTNPLYTPREMKHQFKDSGAKAIIIVANFAFNLDKVIADTDIKHVVVTQLGDRLGFPKKQIVNFVVKTVKKMVPSYSLQGHVKFNDALLKGASLTYTRPTVKNTDLAFIQYTGGTTGVSKGAELNHKNIIANVEGIAQWFKPKTSVTTDLSILGALPFYHIFALTVNALSGVKMGFHNIMIANPRDQASLIKDLKKYPVTIFPGLNTLFNALANNPDFQALDFSKLKITIAGGMALQKFVADNWEKLTGCPIVEGYGLSETSPVLSVNPVDGTQQIGTIGIPFPSTMMKILKEDGTWAQPGEIGEICANGPQVMRGYYNRPEETEKVFIEDETGKRYFKTGDIGLQLPDGFFKIVDRKKDMILVSGFNVYPNEIEDVIVDHPGVLEVACIGVPDERSTEAVKVFVVKKDQSLTEDELRAYAKENLTAYKCPKHIEFRDELPKTNVGKILRRALKEEEEAKSK
ncbi:AMP-binding protein [Jiulongibacter sediminis]|uniref:Long-chain-fatty-acid--CoA ligase n=1 Tax=Jiulongibacter sediminis TaxID=1605367 RepID=A0A0P7BNM5_9BACT|nr:AMP-binding protein [Jiulongibacter sediminis]KPM48827.1 long-chain fatty acid--CoA ligase [Jiulongibacter sediminis]TBX25358.1 long-chain fatty acid--CoA ligase [Jiulongibacter sediminis]